MLRERSGESVIQQKAENCLSDSEVMSSSPLENSEVVRIILSHFGAKELLELSKVNKLWNYEARCLLRDHRICQAFIVHDSQSQRPCVRAKMLNDEMANMKVVPFNSLKVWLSWHWHKCPAEMMGRSVEEVFASLINKLDLKHLDLDWDSFSPQSKSCVLGQLMLRFLQASPKLESLRIRAMPLDVELKIENQLTQSHPGFPKLKILKLPVYDDKYHSSPLIRELLAKKTPNLQALETEMTPGLLEKIPVEKFGALKNMHFRPGLEVNGKILTDLQRLVEKNPQLRRVAIHQPRGFENFEADHPSFWTLLCDLLQSSSNTLEEAELDLHSIKMLIGGAFALDFDLLRFANLSKLYLVLSLSAYRSELESTLLCFPMQNIFPKVTEVTIGEAEWDFPGGSRQFGQLVPGLAANTIKGMIRSFMWDVAPLFPSVQSMATIDPAGPDRELFRWLWGNWPRLECLELTEWKRWPIRNLRLNYVAEFCGIYPEEADLLREMDEEYLKKVNIVPVFSAIYHLKALRELKVELYAGDMDLNYEKDDELPSGIGSRGTFFLSKVTPLIAMRQLNDFKFHLTVSHSGIAPYLEHLKPWVELKVSDYEF